jgi:hypothetical protein
VKVEQYIIAYDAGDTIRPFNFQLQTSQRLVVTRQHKTDAGKKIAYAQQAVKRAEKRAATIEADPEASSAARTLAREKLAAAEAAHRVTVAKLATEPKAVDEKHDDVPRANDGGAVQVKPRSGKRTTLRGHKRRVYGHRDLRINWEEQPEPSDFRGPLDTEEE